MVLFFFWSRIVVQSRTWKEESYRVEIMTSTIFWCCALATVKGLGVLNHMSECDCKCVALAQTEAVDMLICEATSFLIRFSQKKVSTVR